MSRRKPSAKQKQYNQLLEEANREAKRMMADEQLRSVAQVRLHVTSNRFTWLWLVHT